MELLHVSEKDKFEAYNFYWLESLSCEVFTPAMLYAKCCIIFPELIKKDIIIFL